MQVVTDISFYLIEFLYSCYSFITNFPRILYYYYLTISHEKLANFETANDQLVQKPTYTGCLQCFHDNRGIVSYTCK